MPTWDGGFGAVCLQGHIYTLKAMMKGRHAKVVTAQTGVLQRLESAAGHLQGVIKMAKTGESCEELLHQLGAVEAALLAAGCHLLECQVEKSQALIQNSHSLERRTKELNRIRSLYAVFSHDVAHRR